MKKLIAAAVIASSIVPMIALATVSRPERPARPDVTRPERPVIDTTRPEAPARADRPARA